MIHYNGVYARNVTLSCGNCYSGPRGHGGGGYLPSKVYSGSELFTQKPYTGRIEQTAFSYALQPTRIASYGSSTMPLYLRAPETETIQVNNNEPAPNNYLDERLDRAISYLPKLNELMSKQSLLESRIHNLRTTQVNKGELQ